MTKEEKIQEAYGEYWNIVKDYVNENGWCEKRRSMKFEEIKKHCDIEYGVFESYWFRPKSLQGIEAYYSFEKVKGFDFYEVNKLGTVKSIERITIQKNGKKYNVSEKILKPQIDNTGYIVFGLRNENKETKKVYLHRVLAECFIHNPENKPCVNHKDGVKYNNLLSNLEWCTYQENNNHAFDTGLQNKGAEHHLYGKKGVECHNHKDYQPIIKPKPPVY